MDNSGKLFQDLAEQAVELAKRQGVTLDYSNQSIVELEIKKMGSGGEYGLCMFEDNQACEEWALMRGECPIGGVKTTGFDNIEQQYCAWLGGQTLAEANATCTLPNGKTCSDTDLYNGKCN